MRNLANIGKQIAQTQYAGVQVGGSEGLESILEEVSVEAMQIEGDNALCADLENVVGSLESIADQAAASIEDGGLDRQAAGLLEVAVESHMARVGLSAQDSVASLESFGGTGTRVEATQVSVEAIKDKAKQLWDFLVKKFQEARQKVFAWFKKVFSGAAMLKKRAEGIAKKAVDKKGTKKDDQEEIKLGGAAKALAGKDGKADIPALAGDIKELAKVVDGVYRGHAKRVGDFGGDVAGLLDKVAGAPKEDLEGSDADKFFKSGKFMGEDVLAMLVTDFPDGELLGGRTFVVAKADKAGDMTELKSAIDKYNVEFTFPGDGKAPKIADDQKFDAIEPGKVKDIAENIVVLAESIIAFESDYFKHAKNLEKADSAAEKVGKAFDKVSLGTAGAGAEKVSKSLYSAAQRANQNPVNQLTGSVLATARAALEVCDKSLGQYE
tara:strand:+ start:135086 stop:136399 length:1314 start_codon:yes stop_codon:yes gene_type:complete